RTDWWSARVRAARHETPALTGPDAPAWRRAWELSAREAAERPNADRQRGDGWPRGEGWPRGGGWPGTVTAPGTRRRGRLGG
ncbi:MAG: hypothetical protein J2O39_08920, partial [Acidimicrobiales bacterium]|nr:hypothetical protein [Acidimicrobiales bacterium]